MKLGTLEMWIQNCENVPFCIDPEKVDYQQPLPRHVTLEFVAKGETEKKYKVMVNYETRDQIQPFVCNSDNITRYGTVNGIQERVALTADPILNLFKRYQIPNQKVEVTLYEQDNIVVQQ